MKIIKNHDINNATPPVAGTILLCEDLSLGTANILNFMETFLTTSSRNHVIIIGAGINNMNL
tara:strand:+ start:367 stop:552 length:186 start_codon:yes stop_codon:yes gene_type:complete